MKKNLFLVVVFAATVSAHAQTTIYTGNGSLNSNRTVTLSGFNLTFKPSSSTAPGFFINGTNGNIGVNLTSPTEMVDVNGNVKATRGIFTNSSNISTFASTALRNKECQVFSGGTLLDAVENARIFNLYDFPTSNLNPNGPSTYLDIEDRGYYTRMSFGATQNSDSKFALWDKTQTENFTVYDNGNNTISLTMPKANSYVGIGTTSFTDGVDTYHLSVKGNIRANRVKVYTTWADFVFEDDYNLPTLPEVEKYINDNGHLKDIPSAAEVDSKGIELGEMNKLLLQKVEELTLYMIEQNKVNAQQAQQIEDLKKQVKTLSEKN